MFASMHTHTQSPGVSSWGADQLLPSHNPYLEREPHKVVTGASVGGSLAFPHGTLTPLTCGYTLRAWECGSVQVSRNVNESLGPHQLMMTKFKRRRILSVSQDSTSSKGAMKARRRRPASSSAHCCRTALALRTQRLATLKASPASC